MSAKNMRGTSFEEEFLYNLPPQMIKVEATSDSRHALSLAQADGRLRFFWDGRPGEPFDEVIPARPEELFHFSPKRDRVACWGSRAPGFFVNIDGVESPTYAGVSRSVPFTFSEDGRRVAYGILPQPERAHLVVDGDVRSDEPIAPVPAVFSPDGTRLAYAGSGVAPRLEQWIVVDDVRGPEFDGISKAPGGLLFSPDSRRFVYAAVRDGRVRIVLDGQEGPAFEDIAFAVFSPDSERFCYAAKEGGRMWLVVDGNADPKHDAVLEPLFSPDSRRLAYGAVDGKSYRMVVDGVPGPEFADLHSGWRFSPDNSHFAYGAARRGGGLLGGLRRSWIVVRDGTPGNAEFDEIWSFQHFSPDGAHGAYAARRGKEFFVVADEVTSGPYRSVSTPQYSASGRLAYAAQTSDTEYHVFVDGDPGPTVDSVTNWLDQGNIFFSADGRHFAAVVLTKSEERLLIDHELGPRYDGMLRPTFEEDGVVFMAARGSRFYRVTGQFDL